MKSNVKKGFIIALCGFGVLTALIVYKSVSPNYFRANAAKWSSPSNDKSNLLTREDLRNMQVSVLLIDLDDSIEEQTDNMEILRVEPDKILNRNNFKKIQKFRGVKALSSNDQALSARIWMLLRQMGINELYILKD